MYIHQAYTRHTRICKVNIFRQSNGVQENNNNNNNNKQNTQNPKSKDKKYISKATSIHSQQQQQQQQPPTPTHQKKKKGTTTVVMTTYICSDSRVTNLIIGVTVRPFSSGDVAQWGHFWHLSLNCDVILPVSAGALRLNQLRKHITMATTLVRIDAGASLTPLFIYKSDHRLHHLWCNCAWLSEHLFTFC